MNRLFALYDGPGAARRRGKTEHPSRYGPRGIAVHQGCFRRLAAHPLQPEIAAGNGGYLL